MFAPGLPVITPAQPQQAAIEQFFSCTPTQKIDTPHFQHNRIAIKASNMASNIDIKTDQSLHHTTTPADPSG